MSSPVAAKYVIEADGLAGKVWTFVSGVMKKVVRNFDKELFETLLGGVQRKCLRGERHCGGTCQTENCT